MFSTSTLSQTDETGAKDIGQQRIVEREFLGKVSCEEVVVKIITVLLQEERNN